MNRKQQHPRAKPAKELARPEPKQRWTEKTRNAVLRVEPKPEPPRAPRPTKVDTTPPWPFPKREVTLKSSEWQATWKKLKDKTSRDLERENANAQEAIKEALDQRDELQARFTTLEAAVKHTIASLQGHAESTAANLKLLTGLIN
jgi:nucleotide-binding universal stress UspA family protein